MMGNFWSLTLCEDFRYETTQQNDRHFEITELMKERDHSRLGSGASVPVPFNSQAPSP